MPPSPSPSDTCSAQSPSDCCSRAPPADPILATDLGNGVLRLNMGTFAAARLTVNTEDGDEVFDVTADPNASGNVLVTAFGYSQSFAGISTIVANAGDGIDSVTIDAALNVTTTLIGGIGHVVNLFALPGS